MVAPTRPVFFFNGHWILSNFWDLVCYNFCNTLRKNAKLYFLEASHYLWKHAKNHIHRASHYGETAIQKIENFGLFGPFYFKNKKSWHFQFFISHIFQQTIIISENLTYISQPLLKLWAAKLAISFYLTNDFHWRIFKLPVSTFWVIT